MKIIRLTESDLIKLVKRVIKEQTIDLGVISNGVGLSYTSDMESITGGGGSASYRGKNGSIKLTMEGDVISIELMLNNQNLIGAMKTKQILNTSPKAMGNKLFWSIYTDTNKMNPSVMEKTLISDLSGIKNELDKSSAMDKQSYDDYDYED